MAGDDEESFIMNRATKVKIPVKKKGGGAFVIEAHFVKRVFCGAGVNARGAGPCDQAVRPRHVRRVGDGDEEQKAEERVGEHDVEMQAGRTRGRSH